MKAYNMKLLPQYFNYIKIGTKRLELKYKLLKKIKKYIIMNMSRKLAYNKKRNIQYCDVECCL